MIHSVIPPGATVYYQGHALTLAREVELPCASINQVVVLPEPAPGDFDGQIEAVCARLDTPRKQLVQRCLEAVLRMIHEDTPMVPQLVTMARTLQKHGLCLAEPAVPASR